MVILCRPLCLLFQSNFSEYGQNSVLIILISFAIDLITLLACVLLGANRMRALVSAAFIYSIIFIAQIPVVYFILLVVNPLLNTPNPLEASAQIPQLYYFGLFFNNLIITCCCFLAARWLKKMQKNPSSKTCALFCILFISFASVILVWWSDTITIISIPFLASALLGALLVGMSLLAFYLFTRSTANSAHVSGNREQIENEQPAKYMEFIRFLSKRELEVIRAVLAGCTSYKELADSLHISTNTVKTHLQHIYQITNVSNIASIFSLFNGYAANHPEITPEITSESP